MKDKIKNKIILDLHAAEFDKSESDDFLENLQFVDGLLASNDVIIPEGLSGRVLSAVMASQKQTEFIKRNYFNRHLRSIVSAAAMLLVAVSLAFYYTGQFSGSAMQGDGNEAVAKVEISSNPFAHPSLIMDILIDRHSVNGLDGFALEAVSELWDRPESEKDNPTSIRKGNDNETFA